MKKIKIKKSTSHYSCKSISCNKSIITFMLNENESVIILHNNKT